MARPALFYSLFPAPSAAATWRLRPHACAPATISVITHHHHQHHQHQLKQCKCTYILPGQASVNPRSDLSLSLSLYSLRNAEEYTRRAWKRQVSCSTYICMPVRRYTHSGSTSANITINYLNSEVYVRNRQGGQSISYSTPE
ncbi:hypothetical protein C8Q74DRAFT_752651 [Fomes fomentarius]|nr:hypothetical protein C8Q74DRAFT_752651 [Fomes fomentarius]